MIEKSLELLFEVVCDDDRTRLVCVGLPTKSTEENALMTGGQATKVTPPKNQFPSNIIRVP